MLKEENCDDGGGAIEKLEFEFELVLPTTLVRLPIGALLKPLVCGGEVTHGFGVALLLADQSMLVAVDCSCGTGGDAMREPIPSLGREGCNGLLKGDDGVNVANVLKFASGVIARALGLAPHPDGRAEESDDVVRDQANVEDCGVGSEGFEAGMLGLAGPGLFQSPSRMSLVELLAAFRPRTSASKSSSSSPVESPLGVGMAPKEVKSLARVLVEPLVAVSSWMRRLCSLSIRVERDLIKVMNF